MNLLLTPRAVLRRHLLAPVARVAGHPLRSPLAGRVVLITGASSGIGAATVRAVAERGGIVSRSRDVRRSWSTWSVRCATRAVRRTPIRAT